jgi:hypothetical protein
MGGVVLEVQLEDHFQAVARFHAEPGTGGAGGTDENRIVAITVLAIKSLRASI